MTLPRSAFARRVACLAALLLLVVPLVPAPLTAAPVASVSTPTPPGSVPSTLTVSVTPSATAVAVDTEFGFRAVTRLAADASYLRVRLDVNRPTGRLVFRRTQVVNGASAGEQSFSFGRELQGLGLDPGSYPVKVTAVAVIDGEQLEVETADSLLVYDPKARPVAVVPLVRVSGQPLSDPAGRFVADPARFTRTREDMEALCALVLADEENRLTVAIAPLLLSEWRRISQGYELVGPEGTVAVPAGTETPLAYGAALDKISEALATGRLELVSLGYADPDLSDLTRAALPDDVRAQYRQGLSATFASLETTPSTGTVSAGGCVPAAAAEALADEKLGYCAVEAGCAKSGTRGVGTGAYRGPGELAVLVTDPPSAAALASGTVRPVLTRAFQRQVSGRSPQPFIVVAEVGANGQRPAESVEPLLRELREAPWARIANGRQAAAAPADRQLTLTDGEGSGAPAGYWDQVRAGREWADAFVAAVGSADPGAETARVASLIAESATWAGPDESWTLADRGLAFASEAERAGRAVLGGITITAQEVTLAGAKGDVPVNIANPTQYTLKTQLRAVPSDSIRLAGPAAVDVTLRPQDNFVEIPVDMGSALSGTLELGIYAGELEVARQTVQVRASYLDRIAIIAAIAIGLGVALALIVRRVRATEAGVAEKDAGHTRYPDTGEDDDERSES